MALVSSLSNLIVRIEIKKFDSALYAYSVSYRDRQLYEDFGFASIADALMAASGSDGEFLGYEVAYSGITIGTYHSVASPATAQCIAQTAIDTIKSITY